MNSSSVITYDEFDPAKLVFTSYKPNGAGRGGSVQYKYDNGPLYIQTPVNMRLPFGLSVYPDSDPPKKVRARLRPSSLGVHAIGV